MHSSRSKAPFLQHLAELRRVLLQSVLAVAALFVPCYFFRFQLLEIIVAPAVSALPPGSSLIFTRPSEGFVALVQASLFAALLLATPFILHRLWSFLAPGLRPGEKKGLVSFVFFGTALFFAGVAFCHAVVAPRALAFLFGESSPEFLSPMPSVSRTLSFLLSMCLGFGAAFEFPLAAFFLSKWGVVTAEGLAAARKYAYLACAVIAAVITPTTDFASMMFLLLPFALFYEAGILAAKIFGRRRYNAGS